MIAKDVSNENIFSAIELLKLPADQLSIAEEYINGNTDEGSLSKLEFMDLSSGNISQDAAEKIKNVMTDFIEQQRYDEARTLFNVIFAIGKAASHECVPPLPIMQSAYNQLFTDETTYKYLAVYSSAVKNLFGINGDIVCALTTPEINYDQIFKAMECQQHDDSGRLLLTAIYFKKRYTDKILEGANCSKFLEGAISIQPQIEEEDLPLFKEYEGIVVNGFISCLTGIDMFLVNEIKQAILSVDVHKVCPLVDHRIISSGYADLILCISYFNFPLSQIMTNVVSLNIAGHLESALNEIRYISDGLNMNINKIGGSFDKLFGFNGKDYIIWAAKQDNKELLLRQIPSHKAMYIDIIDNGIEGNRWTGPIEVMMEAAREYDIDFYNEIADEREKDSKNKDIRCIAGHFISKLPESYSKIYSTTIYKYLIGQGEQDTLYQYVDSMKYNSYDSREQDLVENYRKKYCDEEFPRRCAVYMLLAKDHGYLSREVEIYDNHNYLVSSEKVFRLFDNFEKAQIGIAHQLSGVWVISNGLYSRGDAFVGIAREVFANYLKNKRKETLAAFSSEDIFERCFALTVLERSFEDNKKEILSYAQDKSRPVKERLISILCAHQECENDIKALLAAKKAGERELAVRVLMQWQEDGTDYNDLFTDMLKKEKNAKLAQLLQSLITGSSKAVEREDIVKKMHKGGRARTIAWLYETPFSTVHRINGEEADERYMQALMLCYSYIYRGMSEDALLLAQNLNADELAVYVSELYEKWLLSGADAIQRWVVYAAAIHGGSDIIPVLYRQIGEWARAKRGEIASEAVTALALNPTPQALPTVDDIARTCKYGRVRAAAAKALDLAVSQLGITREELSDRLIPDFGFDENMERVFDYGGRKFTVTITTALEIEVFDERGKKLKNLPAVGKNDDHEKAEAAYEEFKQMKSQIKAAIKNQRIRLESAFFAKREWSIDAWKALFVKNPIMHQFAIGLIWGIYEDGKLIQSFRYMEDGTFNTENETEYTLPESNQTGRDKIGLVHPIELTDVSLFDWKQQLEDYEITQPIKQLDQPICRLTDEEMKLKSLERFKGIVLKDLSLSGRLSKMGWHRGPAQKDNSYHTYYREDAEAGLGVELHFSGSIAGEYDAGKDIIVYDARFYKTGTIERGKYCRDEVDMDKAIALKEIPPRYISEVILQLTQVTASIYETEETF